LGDDLVNLYVGPTKEHFYVHKDKLCAKVPYFDKMFKGGFLEAANKSATFPEDNPADFDLLIRWIYEDVIEPLEPDIPAKCPAGTQLKFDNDYLDFYVFAEKLCVPELQDRIMDALLAQLKSTQSILWGDTIKLVYKQTSKNSPMRKLAVYTVKYVLECRSFQELCPVSEVQEILQSHEEFLPDLLTLQREWAYTAGATYKVVDPSWIKDTCQFHCHGKEGCYLTKRKSTCEEDTSRMI
jgi:hypothetical protein